MNPGMIGVAISTTGDPHRIAGLQRCVRAWRQVLPEDAVLVVTVDGSEADASIVSLALTHVVPVHQVGQPHVYGPTLVPERMGVAVSKNTGLELLMNAGVEHLFLSDDDTWPLYNAALGKHIKLADDYDIMHSMVMWGRSRLEVVDHDPDGAAWAVWKWPRGVMLYQHRAAVDLIGGMDERFGPGGHEHVEYSRRMHAALMTPDDFCSPASYATRDARGAAVLWHCEDMPKKGEPRHVFHRRKAAQTTIHTTREDWQRIERVMASREGSTDFVSYRAADNGRASATLFQNIPSQGAEESK